MVYSTQSAPTAIDQVSSTYSTSGLCGSITYSLSDTPASGVTALSSSELQLVSGVIKIWTSSVATIGQHTLTLTAHLSSYTSVISSQSLVLTINLCGITSVQVVETSTGSALFG